MDLPRTQTGIEPGPGERIARAAVVAFLVLAVITLAFALGFGTNELFREDSATPASTGQTNDSLFGEPVLDEIYDIIESDFVDKESIDPEALREAAIAGIIQSLNDPHTVYLPPEELASGALDLGSSYQGIGATVDDSDGVIQIIAPFRDSPAEEAGIEAGDIILAVDGEPTDGWTDRLAVQKIRGEAGTTVTLTVQHPDGTVEDITIVRGEIPIVSVFTDPLFEALPGVSGAELVDRDGNSVDDIAYLHIAQFHQDTRGEVLAAIEELEARGGLAGVIIDVRLNPGGLLSSTVEVADLFLDGGRVLTERDGDGRERHWDADSGAAFSELPIVVIQDGSSASGAEVLAAALKDNGRATIVGTTSFGKGTVNRLVPLDSCVEPNCGAIYLSIGRWFRPNGQGIEGSGVAPDIEVELTQEIYDAEGDVQLFAAIDELRSR